jgi:hypothetical protein
LKENKENKKPLSYYKRPDACKTQWNGTPLLYFVYICLYLFILFISAIPYLDLVLKLFLNLDCFHLYILFQLITIYSY